MTRKAFATMLKNKRVVSLIGLLLGSAAGYFYWKYVGCISGTCMIWQNMWMSTGYGAVLGWLIVSTGFDVKNYINKQKQQ
jgi:hypothetical protein